MVRLLLKWERSWHVEKMSGFRHHKLTIVKSKPESMSNETTLPQTVAIPPRFPFYTYRQTATHQHSITTTLSTSRIDSTSTFQWLNRLWSPHSIGLFTFMTTTRCHPLPRIVAARSPSTLPYHMLISDGNEHRVLRKNSKWTMFAKDNKDRSSLPTFARITRLPSVTFTNFGLSALN